MSNNVQSAASVDLAQLIPSARRGGVAMDEGLTHPTRQLFYHTSVAITTEVQ